MGRARSIASSMVLALALAEPLQAQQQAGPLPQTPPAAQPAAATALQGKRVLFLSPYGYGRPGIDNFTRFYIDAMKAHGVAGENLMVEYLNLNRAGDAAYRQQRRALLMAQYGAQKLDLIVALMPPALDYALDELAGLAPGVPLLSDAARALPPGQARGRRVLFQSMAPDMRGTAEQISKLFPATRKVVVAVGTGQADQAFKQEAQAALAGWPGPLQFEYTDGRSFADTLAYVRTLRPGTVLVTGVTNRDKTGALASHHEMTRALAQASSVPAFALYDTSLGLGPLGGSLRHVGREAERLAGYSAALLRGTLQPRDGVTPLASDPVPMYDWRQWQRWGLDPALAGPDVLFVNRPQTPWQQYRYEVLAAGGVIVLLTGMLGVLLLQRRRLARSELRARESEAGFRVLVEHSPEAIMVFDLDANRFVDANTKAERLFVQSRAQLLASGPADLYPAEQFDGGTAEQAIQANARRVTAGEELIFERTVRDAAGRTFPCEVSLCALPAAGRRLVRCGYVDISERKRAQQELLQHRNHLEELVQQRTAALSVAVADAQAANTAKSVFLANMSHELRTPLNSVIGFSQMLAESTSMFEDEKRHLAIINRSGHHLLNLINDILELSKIEAGRVQLQLAPVALEPLLQEVLEMVRVRSEQAGLALLLDCSGVPAQVRADGAKLRQVLLNLLSNAVKFVARGSVTLALHGRSAGPGSVELAFAVRDTGIGIAAEDQQRIFEPFIQAGGAVHGGQGGTGLGLSISREFVRLMGGELRVQSQPGQGATFSFSITAELHQAGGAAPHGAAPARVAGLPDAEQGKVILVVDDHEDCRELLRGLLAPLGFTVAEAADGGAAAGAMAALKPELVLMDWRMPVMDGMALTRWVRAQADLPQPRIVMLTASAFEEEKQLALAAGADAFLRKPIEQGQLYAVLAQQLGLHFIVQQAAAPAAAPAALAAGDLAQLGLDERGALMLAVRELDVKQAAALLATLAARGPAQAALADAIQAMLERHQYLPLWELLQAGEAGAAPQPERQP